MIATAIGGASAQSMMGMLRFKKLEKLEEKYPSWPRLLIYLAECYFLMNCSYGAYLRVKGVQELIGFGSDPYLDKALGYLVVNR